MVVFDSFESFMDFVHLQREQRLHTRTTVSSQCRRALQLLQAFSDSLKLNAVLNTAKRFN